MEETPIQENIPVPQELSPEEPQKPVNPLRRISLVYRILIGIFLIFVAVVIANAFLLRLSEVRKTNKQFNKEPEPVVVREEEPVSKTKKYQSDADKFAFEYPSDLNVETKESSSSQEFSKIYQVSYSGSRQKEAITTDESLEDGYIFKVIVAENVTVPNLAETAGRKLLTYQQSCPDTYSATEVVATTVDTLNAETFRIYSCLSDFEEYFVYYQGNAYEIVKISRGDLGYKERYENSLSAIFTSFRFLEKPGENSLDSPVETFQDIGDGFSFEHPHLDAACCAVPGPVSGNYKTIVSLGDKQTYDENGVKKYDAVGIFVEKNSEKKSFEEYLEQQKQTLRDDYKIIMGKYNSDLSEDKIQVGGIEGVLLKGYAWWGNMVYVPLPKEQKILVISMTEVSPGSFDEVFSGILQSFKIL